MDHVNCECSVLEHSMWGVDFFSDTKYKLFAEFLIAQGCNVTLFERAGVKILLLTLAVLFTVILMNG